VLGGRQHFWWLFDSRTDCERWINRHATSWSWVIACRTTGYVTFWHRHHCCQKHSRIIQDLKVIRLVYCSGGNFDVSGVFLMLAAWRHDRAITHTAEGASVAWEAECSGVCSWLNRTWSWYNKNIRFAAGWDWLCVMSFINGGAGNVFAVGCLRISRR